jgi:hypothetical protein
MTNQIDIRDESKSTATISSAACTEEDLVQFLAPDPSVCKLFLQDHINLENSRYLSVQFLSYSRVFTEHRKTDVH